MTYNENTELFQSYIPHPFRKVKKKILNLLG